jgi:hypothetical protein
VTRRQTKLGKRVRAGVKRGTPALSLPIPRFIMNVLARRTNGSLIAEGWIQDKPCRVTIDIGASVTIVRPDVAGQPERKPSRPNVLQRASEETTPILKEAGQRPKRKDIADRSLIHKSYWAQWNSLAVRDGVLERHWE